VKPTKISRTFFAFFDKFDFCKKSKTLKSSPKNIFEIKKNSTLKSVATLSLFSKQFSQCFSLATKHFAKKYKN